MNRLGYHISRWILVMLPVLLATASAMAQLTVYSGQSTTLQIEPKPGETYAWELYADSTVDFAVDQGQVTADMAEFVNGINTGSRVEVIWHQPGTYYFKLTRWNASQCTNNMQAGIIQILEPKDELIPPEAVPDSYTVDCDPLFDNVTENDHWDWENFPIRVDIVEEPTLGVLHLEDDQGSIRYLADLDVFGTDSFIYRLCLDVDQGLCDTAVVRITIPEGLDCEPANSDTSCHFFIPEGFSPNGDGVHDYFVIDCIEQYPQAKLMIFDQQGYLLYKKENYGNTTVWGYQKADLWWGGQTSRHHHNSDGMVIPGVYLYLLDKGNGDLKRGFVMVAYGNTKSGN
ncbi:gliding motility-associated C-terminal domain-containing protein [Mangrovibacterium marinum]|uniref:Gliding motility-associated-like protein n=1 Tax=Mangrovibacterium marinum TaxID=1639118 RepID=A0A2T5BYT4_9BACT|nr:gliding motility-associated C-terminal domain-containing protein [Mangrovibacterium marinum]PTN07393.1 gliding motility-associated-like protein [Mangrovibacterium marinum]